MQKGRWKLDILVIFLIFILFLSSIAVASSPQYSLPQPQPPSENAIQKTAKDSVAQYMVEGISEGTPPQETTLKPKSSSKPYNVELTQLAPAGNNILDTLKSYIPVDIPSWMESIITNGGIPVKIFDNTFLLKGGSLPSQEKFKPLKDNSFAISATTGFPGDSGKTELEPTRVAVLSAPITSGEEDTKTKTVSPPLEGTPNEKFTNPPRLQRLNSETPKEQPPLSQAIEDWWNTLIDQAANNPSQTEQPKTYTPEEIAKAKQDALNQLSKDTSYKNPRDTLLNGNIVFGYGR